MLRVIDINIGLAADAGEGEKFVSRDMALAGVICIAYYWEYQDSV